MDAPTWLWIRHETRPNEQRAPVVPEDVARLVEAGLRVTVEESPDRAFPLGEYVAAGAEPARAGGWVEAPEDACVVGLKELPDQPGALRHRHVYFGHAFKGQPGAGALLSRFAAGGGTLLDLESLVDEEGRRVAAFGHWAGYVGAALAVLHRRGVLESPLRPTTSADLEAQLAAIPPPPPERWRWATSEAHGGARALVIGAGGRTGGGAVAALRRTGFATTRWDIDDTRRPDIMDLLRHDVLVNCILATEPRTPFVTPADAADRDRRLSVIADVTCDVGSELNMLPVNTEPTSWERPVRRVAERPQLDIIAIDNLPSLLPVESSRDFSAALVPHLLTLGSVTQGRADPVWQRAHQVFHDHVTAGVAR